MKKFDAKKVLKKYKDGGLLKKEIMEELLRQKVI